VEVWADELVPACPAAEEIEQSQPAAACHDQEAAGTLPCLGFY